MKIAPNLADDVTSIIKRAIDLLFIKNPAGTSMGVFVGVVLHWLSMLFLPIIEDFDIINVAALRLVYFIPLGIVLFNIKYIVIKGHKYDLAVEKALDQVRKAEKQKFISKSEAKLQYTNIIRSYVKTYAKGDIHIEKNDIEDNKA